MFNRKDKLRNAVQSILDESLNDLIDSRLKELLQDANFLKIVGKELDKAEALRLSENRKRELEELSEKEIEMENSSEPWFDFVLTGIDPEKGAMTRMGWNSAFIKYLRSLGINDPDEDLMVVKWFALIRSEWGYSE